MANSTIGIKLDDREFKEGLESLKNEYANTMQSIMAWESKVNELRSKSIALEKELAAAKAKVASTSRSSTVYKSAQNDVKRLQAELKTVRAEYTAGRRTLTSLTQATNDQRKAMRALGGATKTQIGLEKKETAVRNSSVNAIVRKIRQYETLIVAFYSMKKAYDLTLGAAIDYNAMIESEQIGLRMLINQTTEYVNAQGEVITGMEAYKLAAEEAASAMDIVREINIDTPHTLTQTLSIFKLLTPQVKMYGGSLKEVGEITKGVSLLASQIGVQYQEILKTVDAVMSGAMNESGLKRAMEIVGITNQEVKRIKAEGGDLVQFFIDKLKATALAADDTRNSFKGLVAQFDTLFSEIRGKAFEPIFEGVKDKIASMNKAMRENKEETIDDIREITRYLADMAKPVANIGLAFAGWKISNSVLNFFSAAGLKRAQDLVKTISALSFATKGWVGVAAGTAVGGYLYVQSERARIKAEIERANEKRKADYNKDYVYVVPDEVKKQYRELEREAQKLIELRDKALGVNDIEKAKKYALEAAELLKAKYALRKKILVGSEEEKKYTQRPKTPKDFTKSREWAEELRDALKEARLEYSYLVGDIDKSTYLQQEAIDKYNAAYKNVQELQAQVGSTTVDQQKLKKKLLEAEVELEKRKIDYLKVIVGLEKESTDKERKQKEKLQADLDKLQSKYLSLQKPANDYEKLNTLVEKGMLSPESESYSNLLDAMNEKTIKLFESTDKYSQKLKELGKTIESSLTSSMQTFFDITSEGFMDFGELASDVLNQIYQQIVQLSIIDPFVSSVSPSITEFVGSFITPYANGGIIDSPIAFPTSSGVGIAGEAGTEAIMPVTRVGGDLGVKATPSNVVINVQNETGLPIDMEKIGESMNDDGTKIIEVVMRHAQTDPEFRAAMGIR